MILTKQENDFIMSIYGMRHKYNGVVILIPCIGTLVFSLIAAPVIIAVCDTGLILSILMIVVPLPLVAGILLIRKLIIVKRFIKEKDVADKVIIHKKACNVIDEWKEERVLFFTYSENMVTLIYNWMASLGVIPDNRLTLYQIEYTFPNITYLGIRENELNLTRENREKYIFETKNCITADDIWNGKIAVSRVASRLSNQ